MKNKTFGLPRSLGEGVTLRWATPADADALAAFNLQIHSDNPEEPETFLDYWTRELMAGQHPTTKADDFTMVVDEKAGDKIVSSLNLISQTWAYDGIPFGVGRPELVGTDPAYRRRGLVRAQFEAIHAKSAARGELMQAITGIPWYYRQFGYEMGVDLGGSRAYYLLPSRLSQAAAAEAEPAYQLRPAQLADLPLLREFYAQYCRGSLLSRLRDDAIWQHELFAAHRETPYARHAFLITAVADSTPVGYVEISPWQSTYYVRELAVRPGHSLRAVALFVIRHLEAEVAQKAEPAAKPMEKISFQVGTDHPLYRALDWELEKQIPPYGWYIRVPDVAAFLSHIRPVLEQRLAESVIAGHSGSLRLNFYTSQLELKWENGRLAQIQPYRPENFQDGHAFFPGLTFLQLLFGHRSIGELQQNFVDCSVRQADAAVLLAALFPKRPSWLVPLG